MIPDGIVYDLGIAGGPEAARERLRAPVDDPLVDRPIVYVPPQAGHDVLDRTVKELVSNQL